MESGAPRRSCSTSEKDRRERCFRIETERRPERAQSAAGTYKTLRHLTTPMAAHAHMEEAGDVVVLSSNNYLGLCDDPEVVAAGIAGLEKYGAGTSSVRFICGTFDIHRELEAKIASFFGFEAALSYVSCWTANEGLLPTVGTAGNT
jgi:glycine C-acetyltransferase